MVDYPATGPPGRTFDLPQVEKVWGELKAWAEVERQIDRIGYRAAKNMLDIFEEGFDLPRAPH